MAQPSWGARTYLCVETGADASVSEVDQAAAVVRTIADGHGGLALDAHPHVMLFGFSRASDAASAALAARRALAAAPHLEDAGLGVRMGIDTGEAEEDDPAGVPAYGAMALCAAARAGGILLGRETHDVVAEHPPARATLIDEGLHRLADLGAPRRVYRLEHPDIAGASGALRTLDALPNNLPVQLTSFVGRAREMRDVRDALARARIVTLWGTGGSGKTRLAVHAGAAHAASFEAGVWFVDLAGARDGALVLQAVADVVGAPGTVPQDAIAEHIGDARALVILDNCEQVLDGAREAARAVVDRCPRVSVLATSRERLGIDGEIVYPVPPLALPAPGDDPGSMGRADAVRLFAARARAVAPAFVVDDAAAPHVADVCRRIDGIPLAIELAASRLRVLGIAEIAERLADRFRLLAGGAQEAPQRQQTLRALIEWSHDLMTEAEQRLFRRLSVFAGSFGIEAAEAVCAGDGVDERAVLDLVAQLAERSMLMVEASGARVRYRLLESIRDYASDAARAVGEAGTTAARHAAWFARRSSERYDDLVTPEQARAAEWFAAELGNIRAAFAWALEHDRDLAVELAANVSRFFEFRGLQVEGASWIDRIRPLEPPPSPASVRAFCMGANFHRALGRTAVAEEMFVRALSDAEALGSPVHVSTALGAGGSVALARGDVATALERYTHSAEVLRALPGERVAYAMTIGNLAVLAHESRDLPGARAHYEEAIEQFRELGDERHLARALGNYATLLNDSGDFHGAIHILQESLRVSREMGDRTSETIALNNLAYAYENLGEYHRAVEMNLDVLAIVRETREAMAMMVCLFTFAEIALALADGPSAARLLGAGNALDAWSGDLEKQEESIKQLVALMGREETDRLLARGAREGVDIASELATEVGRRALEVDLAALATSSAPASRRNLFRRTGEYWEIVFAGTTIRLKDAKGLSYLARLLREEGKEIPAAELAGAGADPAARGRAREAVGVVESHAGEVIDATAAASYRTRLGELETEIEEATSWGDPERAARAREELAFVTEQLGAAFGIGGRARTAADPQERARKAVTNRIKDAVNKIAGEHPALGKHLTNAVRTGIFCSYMPDTPVGWDVDIA